MTGNGAEPRSSRRQFLRAATAGSLVAIAGCGGRSREVRIEFVAVQDLIDGIHVTISFGNGAERSFRILAHAKVAVGEGEDTRTFRKSKQKTLPPLRSTDVEILIDRGELFPGPMQEPMDATAMAEFIDADRPPLGPRKCDRCPEEDE